MALTKSNVVMPEEVSFRRVLTALEIARPNLGILLGTIESKGVGTSIQELKRLTNKLFGAQFMESNEEILNAENAASWARDDGSDDEHEQGNELALMGTFVGQDGEAYELHKVRPKKTTIDEG